MFRCRYEKPCGYTHEEWPAMIKHVRTQHGVTDHGTAARSVRRVPRTPLPALKTITALQPVVLAILRAAERPLADYEIVQHVPRRLLRPPRVPDLARVDSALDALHRQGLIERVPGTRHQWRACPPDAPEKP